MGGFEGECAGSDGPAGRMKERGESVFALELASGGQQGDRAGTAGAAARVPSAAL